MKSEKEKMLTGDLYDGFDAELVAERGRAYELFSQLNNIGRTFQADRTKILTELLGECGQDVWVESPFYCDYGYNIILGDGVFINFNCTILDSMEIRIGDGTLIGPGVHIYSATHPTDPKVRAKGLENAKPVTIGSNIWIGGGVIVCPGVRIGDNTTIGAGSVVTKDIPANVVAAGNPCRVIREIEQHDKELE
ncbi:Maltose O-acetyltransferase [Anaerohalosphaera lusitana]|uniref:Maltose O-acetyltransferase n=1 Tax=Anaerohalosphaera lusitana TaxID=1936003 RepID=A0A1U9NIF6_9BACT|nr:sugar O-acetyltransferase [Anaerohalosphaera lusitana]AQT67605.1 Maltose O-acetyltransferase [Anaerohalosphaera lusitana]